MGKLRTKMITDLFYFDVYICAGMLMSLYQIHVRKFPIRGILISAVQDIKCIVMSMIDALFHAITFSVNDEDSQR